MGHQPMHRWNNWIVFVFLFSLLLSACKPSPPSPAPTVINFLTVPIADIKDYVEQFQAVYPNVQINVTHRGEIPEEWPKHFDAALMPGSLSNYQADLLLDLMPLIESDEQFNTDDYLPGALPASYVEGRLVALPVDLTFDVLIYNSRQLAAADVALPAPGWSWSEFQNTVTDLIRFYEGGDATVFASNGDQFAFLLGWFEEQAPFYKNTPERLIPALDYPEVQAALVASCELFSAGSAPQYIMQDVLPQMQTGAAAMTIVPLGLAHMGDYQKYPDLALAALPNPSQALRITNALGISRGTVHPQVVWQWLEFLSRQFLTQNPNYLPARRSVAQEQRVWEDAQADVAQVMQAIMADQAALEITRHPQAQQIIEQELLGSVVKTCLNGVPANMALKDAQEKAQENLTAWYAEQKEELPSFNVAAPAQVAKTDQTLHCGVVGSQERFFLAAAEEYQASFSRRSIQISGPSADPSQKVDCFSIEFDILAHPFDLWFFTNQFLSLGSVAELAPTLSDDSFFPQAIGAVSRQGQLFAVPIAISPLVLYYDAEIFIQLGLAPPDSSWTVEDVLNAAEKIKAAAPRQLGYAPHSGAETRFVLAQLGIPLFSAEPQPQPRFTEPEVFVALERLRALQDGYGILTNAATSMALPVGQGITKGDFRHAVALEPRPNTRWPVRLLLTGVLQESTNIQMAWKWITFLLERGGIHSDQMLSSIRTEATDGSAQEELGNELHTAYLTALERDKTQVDLEGTLVQDIAATWFDRALQEIGAGDLESALTEAQVNAQQFIACQSGVPLDMQAIVTCVQQVDPGHPLAKINLVQ